jgi:hypothetical protein
LNLMLSGRMYLGTAAGLGAIRGPAFVHSLISKVSSLLSTSGTSLFGHSGPARQLTLRLARAVGYPVFKGIRDDL